jgi:hypothetical protein
MPRVQVGSKRQSPSEKRAAAAAKSAAAAAADETPARRGEPDESPGEHPAGQAARQDDTTVNGHSQGAPAEGHLPTQATPEMYEVPLTSVTTARETADALTYVAPPEGASELERLVHAQRGITNANRALEERAGALEQSYVLSAGRYFKDVLDNDLYKQTHKSLEAWVKQWPGLTRKDVYRYKDAVPVFDALQGQLTAPLNLRQIRELAVVYREGGNDAVREVWAEAQRRGRTSAAGITEARRLLGAGDVAELLEAGSKEPSAGPKPAQRLAKAVKALSIEPDILRQVNAEDPEAARSYVEGLRMAYESASKALESEES